MKKNGTPQIYKITLFMIKKENYGKFDFFFFHHQFTLQYYDGNCNDYSHIFLRSDAF